MRLDAIHNSPVDAINLVAAQLKRKLEKLGAYQVEIYRANRSEPEASVQADISDHVAIQDNVLVRVTAPDEFIIQVPTRMARMIGIKDSQAIHGIDQLKVILTRIMQTRGGL